MTKWEITIGGKKYGEIIHGDIDLEFLLLRIKQVMDGVKKVS